MVKIDGGQDKSRWVQWGCVSYTLISLHKKKDKQKNYVNWGTENFNYPLSSSQWAKIRGSLIFSMQSAWMYSHEDIYMYSHKDIYMYSHEDIYMYSHEDIYMYSHKYNYLYVYFYLDI